MSTCSWKFKRVGDKTWYDATVPGTVHTDLLSNKLIPDPFYAANETQLQWIENEDWEYQTTFFISSKEFNQNNIELQFDGLDTYAKVYLNDSLILLADNMFRTWVLNVKKYVHRGNNSLHIVFESAVKKGKTAAKELLYTLPGDEKVFSRKAQYQYGWDWGPRFVTCGIWKNVHLRFWNHAKIKTVQFYQNELNDSIAKLKFVMDISCDSAGKYTLFLGKHLVNNPHVPSTDALEKVVPLKKGENHIEMDCDIAFPQRWWTNGLGKANLYFFTFSLTKGKQVMDYKTLTVGLRTLELIQQKDKIGASFYFKLNGVPVFMKGANYIPSDNFMPRVTDAVYDTVVSNAVAANMNMLRVWGGGVYADDAFYEACDRNGILVWQDLMFACAMYPGDAHFVENVKSEVYDQAIRLRNHPSLAIWCGNNEVDEGWKNWGWQKQYNYSASDSTKIARDYKRLFETEIKEVLSKTDSSHEYWPSSPSIGWGHPESLKQGDAHYWGVWWGMEPFDVYKQKVGRFMSEYGFQGMPCFSTFKKMGAYDLTHNSKPSDLKGAVKSNSNSKILPGIDSLVLNQHQKHPTGYQTIQTYLERDYNTPNSFENKIYVSQLLQAEGMKTAIEAHRRAMPYCMGTLYWQLNDCWPVTSWSSVDYYNNWKALHYQVKRSFKDILISFDEQKDSLFVYVVSDRLKPMSGTLEITLNDFNGKILWKEELPVVIMANTSGIYFKGSASALKTKGNSGSSFVNVRFTSVADSLESHYFFVKPKELLLEKPSITIKPIGANLYQLVSDKLAKDVFLEMGYGTAFFGDNFFDLLPNQKKVIFIQPNLINAMREPGDQLPILIKSLVDTY